MIEPAYLHLCESGGLKARAEEAGSRLTACRLCPRQCGVNRLAGEQGFCRTGRRARVASAYPHFNEEAPLVGRGGSGTIFFGSCNLLCTFCQNREISHGREGADVEPARLAGMMLDLMRRGCHNINLVTPSHVIPQILEALVLAVEGGLSIPLVYNSGGYDEVDALRLLDGVVDIYMPDFKFWDERWSRHYAQAADYPEKARAAVREMHRQVGNLQIDERGIAVRGLLVRHLVMPNGTAGTASVMEFLAREISADTYVNVMAQYRPCGTAATDRSADRPILREELAAAVAAARRAGLHRLD